MDDVLEENLPNHALKEQQEMAKRYRNIGIGIMGVADMFVKLRKTYGSKDSIRFMLDLQKFIFRTSVYASVKLAEERGNFEGYSPKIWEAEIIKKAFTELEIEALKRKNKLRNCSLLSIAPSGSIATMLGISTGVEPFFALSYNRKTESLHNKDTYYKVYIQEANNYMKKFNTTELPSYFVCSKDIHWRDRIKMQAVMQIFVDTAISSTVNLPRETTVKDVEDLYIEAWLMGLKGVTIYVEGSRDAILSTDAPLQNEDKSVDVKVKKRPKVLEADYYQTKVKGQSFCVIVGLSDGKPYEVFAFNTDYGKVIQNHKGRIIKVKKQHYSFESDLIKIDDLILSTDKIEERASTLYASMLMRHGADVEFIVKTAKKVDDNISSFSSAMCRVLSKYIDNKETGEKCPECAGNVIRQGGCLSCQSCGWSKCG